MVRALLRGTRAVRTKGQFFKGFDMQSSATVEAVMVPKGYDCWVKSWETRGGLCTRVRLYCNNGSMRWVDATHFDSDVLSNLRRELKVKFDGSKIVLAAVLAA
jgi:hypothetical protein